jgi:uncharacterized protein
MSGETREALEIEIAGQPVVLLPERALYYPAENALVVADLHWGKAASMRASHVPVPTGTTASDLARLSVALEACGADRLVILGDLLHARNGRQAGTLGAIAEWRALRPELEIVLVRGNHDTHAGDPPADLRIGCHDAPYDLGVFTCVHDPDEQLFDGSFTLAGHVHPSITLTGRARQRLRLCCFVFSDSLGILPAFSSFTGGGMYDHVEGDRVFVIANDQVMPARAAT